MKGGLLVLTALVLAVGHLGYLSWRLGVGERDALTKRTELELLEERSARRMNRLDKRVRRTRLGRSVGRRIERAGLRWRVLDVLLGVAAIMAAVLVVALGFVSWWIAVAVAVASGWLSLKYLDRREEQRREAFIGQLPEVARVLSNATSAGLALRSAIRMAAEDLADPAGTELQYLCDELDIGTALDDATQRLHERLPSRELSLLTRTLVIQSRAGGAVVTALQEMSETLEARKDVRREVRTMLAGSVFTGWIVAILGVGSVLVLNLIAPGTLDKMTHSVAGQVVLGIAVGLFAFGFFLIRRTVRIEV